MTTEDPQTPIPSDGQSQPSVPPYGQPQYGQPPYGQGQPPYGQTQYGQTPYGQPPYDQSQMPPYGWGVPPQQPRRSVGKLVAGIILTVLGGLMFLGQLASLSAGTFSSPANGAEALGRMIGIVLFIAIPLVVGILLIVKSKPKQ